MPQVDKHWPLGGSSAHIWVKCHGMPTLRRFLPSESKVGAAAARGTRVHDIAHDWLERGALPEGAVQDEIDEAAEYRDAVRSKFKSYCFERPLIHPTFPTYIGGTCDGYSWDEDAKTLWIWDLKTGKEIVSPYENWQLLFYEWLLFLNPEGRKPTLINLGIFQDHQFAWWCLANSDIEKYHLFFENATTGTMATSNLHIETGEHCLYCKCKDVCFEYKKRVRVSKEIAAVCPNATTLTEW